MPPCWRGQSGTTLQVWDFDTGANPAAPTAGENAYGASSAAATLGLGAGGWISSLTLFGTNQGVWDLGRNGTLTLLVPNAPVVAGAWKLVSVEVSQYRDAIYNANAAVTIPGATLVSTQTVTNQVLTNNLGAARASWVVVRSLWLIDPSPAAETITITGGFNGAAIDQVVVDTLSTSSDSGDVFAPCWRRLPGTTYANWSFHNNTSPASPELKTNPGLPTATILVPPTGLGLGWMADLTVLGCREGLWDLGVGGTITLDVPETSGGPLSYRYVRVQVVEYQEAGTYAQPAQVAVSGGVQVGAVRGQILENNMFGGSWVTHETVWRVAPSPGSDVITLTGSSSGALIDQVTVDALSLEFASLPDLTLSADANSCDKTNVTWSVPTVDGCFVSNVVCSPPVGSTFPVGTIPVVCMTFDTEGGTNVCNFNVTIKDTQAPVAVAPADIVVAASEGSCGAVVTFSATAQDNCPGATVTCTPPSGSLFPLGVTTVSCVATDAASNMSATSTFTVRVVDFTGDVFAPCWRGNSNATFQQWAFSTGATNAAPELKTNTHLGLLEATVTLGPLGLGWQNQLSGWGCRQGYWDMGMGGTIGLSIPERSGTGSTYRYVRVQTVQFYQSGTYDTPMEVTIAGGIQVGSVIVTSIETNGFGGQWVVYQTVWKVAPGADPQDVLLTAGVSGALVDQVIVDTLNLEPPACPGDIVLAADPGECTRANVTWPVPAADGCVVQAVQDTPATGATFSVGITPVTRVVTDAEGQTQTCGFNVVVIDDQPPTIAALSATQDQFYVGTVDVKDGAHTTMQGTVDITVLAYDSCPLGMPPVVTLTNGGVGEMATYVNESPTGTFRYTWPVTATTLDGTWVTTVVSSDGANTTTTNFTLSVNTAAITVTMLPLSISNSLPVVRFAATPGYAYSLERSTDLKANSWTTLTNLFLPLPPSGNGVGEYLDSDGVVSNGFYRARYP